MTLHLGCMPFYTSLTFYTFPYLESLLALCFQGQYFFERHFALVDFFALVGLTDLMGFLESGFRGTSFSSRNSVPHFGQVRRDIKSLSMIVPMTK